MKIIRVIFYILVFSLTLESSLSATEVVRISTGEYPPFLSKKLKYYGVGLRIVREAFALEGVKVKYGFFPWKRAYHYVVSGKWDASATWSYKPERDKDLYFSDPLYDSKFVFYHLKTYKFEWDGIEDLQGVEIGATGGYTYTSEFYRAIEQGKLKVHFDISDKRNLEKLLKGRIQVFPVNIDVAHFLLLNDFPPSAREKLTYHRFPFSFMPTHLVFSKKNKESKRLLQLFNQGLKKLRDSGKIEQYFMESRRGDYLVR